MAGKSMTAWSKFETERNEQGQPTKTIMPGDTVSQSDLGVSDEEWEYLVETGAVREEEYPDVPDDVSPAEYQKQVTNAAVNMSEAQAAVDEATSLGVEPPPEGEDRQPNVDTPVAKQPEAARASAEKKG